MGCQTSKTRMCARLEIRTGRLAHEMQSCWLDKAWVRVMVEFGTSSAFRGWVRVLGYGFGVRGKKVARWRVI